MKKIKKQTMKMKSVDQIHGEIYQLKLMMLFLYRGISLAYNFTLGTEITAAEKFDDLVFEYKDDPNTFYYLIQAKHRFDETQKINKGALLTTSDGDFSLVKYFFSYHKSKTEALFKNGSIKHVIICTNIDLELSGLTDPNGYSYINEITIDDPVLKILNVGGGCKTPKYYRFSDFASVLKPELEKYSLEGIAQKLTEFVLNNKMIAPDNNLFEKYKDVLAAEVIDVKTKRLHSDFIADEKLSHYAKRFRVTFMEEVSQQSNSQIKLDEINEAIDEGRFINGQKIGFNLRNDFIAGNACNPEWPESHILVKNVKEFLDVLVLAVHQANEIELGKAIGKEMGNHFNAITTEIMYKRIMEHMLYLLQCKDKSGEKGKKRFFSSYEGKCLIKDIRKEIVNLLKPNLEYELQSTCFYFDHRSEVFNFLSSSNDLWILSSETPWLTSLYIYQYVTAQNNDFFYHFLYWKDLSSSNQKFENFLLTTVVLETMNATEISSVIGEIYQRIPSAATSNSKKIIIIAPLSRKCRQQLKADFQFYDEELIIELSKMKESSRQDLLKSRKVIFREIPEKYSLYEILSGKEQSLLKKNRIDQFEPNAKETELLLKNTEIELWNKSSNPFEFNSVYAANKRLHLEELKNALTSSGSDIFTFVGDENKIKKALKNTGVEFHRFSNREPLDTILSHRLIILNFGREKEEFHLLYLTAVRNRVNPKPFLHKIKYLNSREWVWLQTYSQDFYIPRSFKRHILNRDELLKLLCIANSSDFFHFSGLNEEDFFKFLPGRRFNIPNRVSNTHENKLLEKKDIARNCSFQNDCVPDDHYSTESKHGRKDVHWIKTWEEDGKLKFEWELSTGNLKEMRNLLSTQNSYSIPEDDFLQFLTRERVIILEDNPGMGKSTTLTKLSELIGNENPMSMVFKIDLNKVKDFRNTRNDFRSLKISDLVNLLLKIQPQIKRNSLTRRILEYKLMYPEHVFLLFDGFNEMVEEEQNNLLQCFKFILSKTKASICITTRPRHKEVLEDFFSVLSYKFYTITETKQIKYLRTFCETVLKFSGKNLQNFDLDGAAHSLTKNFEPILIKEYELRFAEIPLMLRMLAEKYMEVINTIIKADSREPLSEKHINDIRCIDIYESFVRNMYGIYFFDKIRISGRFDEDSQLVLRSAYSKSYGRFAVHSMRDPSTNYLGSKEGKISMGTLFDIGLIQTSKISSATFVHPTFNDYFSLEFICNKLKKNPLSKTHWDFLVNKLLVRPFSRRLFNNKLERDCFLNLLGGKEWKSIMYDLLLKQVENECMNVVLWEASEEELRETVSFLLKSATNEKEIANLLEVNDSNIPSDENDDGFMKFALNQGKEANIKRKQSLRWKARNLPTSFGGMIMKTKIDDLKKISSKVARQ